MSKLDQVLTITKEIHDHEERLRQLRLELSMIVDPVHLTATRSSKRTLAKKVARSVGKGTKSSRSKSVSNEDIHASILAVLKKEPLNGRQIKKLVAGSTDRIYNALSKLAAAGEIEPLTIDTISSIGKHIKVKKWRRA